ncbi:MAG: tRNA threonylcarbamoyladenosine dehydratase [Myxococcales bacterium]|nr:tRNA threonylcarbamoyladenosine dehydratase [Myxococcales bacterium]MCB9530194.1 tRNA threonylcarbamoyladenosine dehydratase [Myxococcales bacterium]MCB9533707.1 tRNA threonylcarbamoyladenosine dehydratase [Myxococcales bacterium]
MLSDDHRQRFGGVARLYGTGALEALQAAHVAVVGIGGVGTWAVEALARSGVGTLTLVDLDDVCVTNTNRQLAATSTTIGRSKVDVMADRAQQIAPECVIHRRVEFFDADSSDALLTEGPRIDWVVDAIDAVPAKALLLAQCAAREIGVVTCGGAGGRTDPTQVRAGTLAATGGDPLLKAVRKMLRSRHGVADGAAIWDTPAVYSTERPRFPGRDGEVCDTPDAGAPLRLDCATGFGTAAFGTGAFGLAAAGIVVSALAARR